MGDDLNHSKEKEKDTETSSILSKIQTSTSSNSIDDIEKNIIIEKPIHLQSANITKPNLYKFGYTWAFWYKDGEPLIIIGPHCKNCIF